MKDRSSSQASSVSPPKGVYHNHQYQNSSIDSGRPAASLPIRSQYLSPGGPGTPSPPALPDANPIPSYLEERHLSTLERNKTIKTPSGTLEKPRGANKSNSNTLERNRNIPIGSHVRKMINFKRQQSQSSEDLTDHRREMVTQFWYNNNSYEGMMDGSSDGSHTVGFTYSSIAGKDETSPKTPYEEVNEDIDPRYVRESQAPGGSRFHFLQAAAAAASNDDEYAVPYAQIRPQRNMPRLRKSVSNPDLLERDLKEEDRRFKRTSHEMPGAHASGNTQSPANWKYFQSSELLKDRHGNPNVPHLSNSPAGALSATSPEKPPKVFSPPFDSIGRTHKTKTFKKQVSQDYMLSMTKYKGVTVNSTSDQKDSGAGESRQSSHTERSSTASSVRLPSLEGESPGLHMETLC